MKFENLVIIAAYAPEEGREEDSQHFYNSLQKIVQRTHPEDDLIITGDTSMNAQVGSEEIGKTTGTFGVGTTNANGRKLTDFCIYTTYRLLLRDQELRETRD